jgi:hypothetical protein
VPELNLVINGDCSGATTAINSTRAATESMRGLSVMIPVTVAGGIAAVTALGRVGAARDAAGGTVALGVDTSALDAGRGALSDFRGEFQAASRDFASVGGVRSFGLQDDGSLRQLSGGVRALGSGLGATEGAFGRLGMNAAASLNEAGSGVALLDRSLGDVSAGLDGAAGGLDDLGAGAVGTFRDVRAEVQGLASDLAGGGSGGGVSVASALDVVNKVKTGVAAPRGPGASAGGVTGGGAGGSGGGSGGSGGGPTPPRGSGLGGGGGGAGREGDGIRGLAMPALVGLAGGAVDEMIGAAAGLLSVNEAIKDTPGLARAASGAMADFNRGVRSTASSALGEGVPAFRALGQALGPLGQEVGRVGAQQMGAVLGGATQLAGSATTALKSLEPAIGPAITGAVNLGNAFLQGVADPAVSNAVKGLGESLSSTGAASAVSDLTTGLLTTGGIAATVFSDVVGGAANVLNSVTGGQVTPADVSPALTAGGLGAWAGKGFGGVKGGLVGGVLAAGGEVAAQAEQAHGMDAAVTPTILGEGLGAGLGGLLFGKPGALVGGAVGGGIGSTLSESAPTDTGWGRVMNAVGSGLNLTGSAIGDFANAPGKLTGGPTTRAELGRQMDQLGRQGFDFDQRLSQATGLSVKALTGTPWNPEGDKAPAGATGAASGFPTGQTAGAYGWTKDPNTDALSPSSTPGGGGGVFAGGPGATQLRPTPAIPTPSPLPQGTADADRIAAQIRGPVPPSSPGATGGFGQGAPTTASAQLLQQLNAPTTQLSASMSQLGQSTAATAPPLSQVTQHATAAASTVTQLSQNSAAAMAPLKSIAPTASAGIASASKAISASSASLGQSVPAAMASGIDSNQGAACDAANQMGKSAVNCGAAALNAASPSKEFVELGVGIPTGLAIGVDSATGTATSAVSSAMGSVVSAGAAGLSAASPSKAFTQFGAGMVQQAVQGAQGQMGAAQAQLNNGLGGLQLKTVMPRNQGQELNNTLSNLTGANMPQQRQADLQRQAEQAQQDQDKQNSPEQLRADAFAKGLDRLGYSDATKARLEGRQVGHDKHADDLKTQRDASHLRALQQAGAGAQGSPFDMRNNPNAGDAVKLRQQDAVTAARSGLTPGQVAQNRQNQALGAGNANAPIPATAQLLPPNLQAQAAQAGNQVGQGYQQGLQQGTPGAADAAGNMGGQAIDTLRKKSGTNSPSVFADQVGQDVGAGLVGGLGTAISSASAAIAPVASNSGLMVGYVYGRSVISGVDSVIKSADFQTAAVSGIGSQLAETALGQLGMLGPAGSGAAINKTSAVTLGSTTDSTPVQVTNHVYLDGQLIQTKIDTAFAGLATSISLQ